MNTAPLDSNGPVTIATFPNPSEAELARAALASQGIEAFVHCDHGQYNTASSWVQLQVARQAHDAATAVLEQDPQLLAGPLTTPAADRPDDMQSLRLQRRFTLARWFLGVQAFGLFWMGFLFGPLFMIPAGLALWSLYRPRVAFGVALVPQTAILIVSIVTSGPSGLVSLIPLLAVYFAWMGAVPEPPEQLLTTPYPVTPSVDIGDAWNVPAVDVPEQPTRVGRKLAIVLAVLIMLWLSWLILARG